MPVRAAWTVAPGAFGEAVHMVEAIAEVALHTVLGIGSEDTTAAITAPDSLTVRMSVVACHHTNGSRRAGLSNAGRSSGQVDTTSKKVVLHGLRRSMAG